MKSALRLLVALSILTIVREVARRTTLNIRVNVAQHEDKVFSADMRDSLILWPAPVRKDVPDTRDELVRQLDLIIEAGRKDNKVKTNS